MGSFLQACCITNQSVQEGEEVYIVPIMENIEGTKVADKTYLNSIKESVYNTDMFKPLGFIFKGVYADYGRYDIDWNLAENKLMFIYYLNYLKESSLKVEQGENSVHDIPFDATSLVIKDGNYDELWDQIHEAIWEGRLFLKENNYMPNIPTIYCKVHYHISIKHHSDILIDLFNKKSPSRYSDFTTEQKTFSSLNIQEQAKEFVSKNFDIFNEKTSFSSRKYKYFLDYNSTIYSWSVLNFEIISNLFTDITNSDLENLYTLLVSLKYLTSAMSSCHIVYRPVYYGSQDYGNSLGNNFCYLMNQVHQYNISRRLDNLEEDLSKEQVEQLMLEEGKKLSY